jgi:hypothetical protein
LLGDWIGLLSGGKLDPQPPGYPNGHSFCLCLSHDVDRPRKFPPDGLIKVPAKVLLRRESPLALRQMWTYLRTGKDPHWNLAQIIDLEQEYGCRSTFFLLAGRGNKRCDPPYSADPGTRARLCETILGSGGEVGLHGSYESYLSAGILRQELLALQEHAEIRGCRQHFLRLDVQYTLAALEQAGLLYDSSLGFAGAIGFRSGFAAPYHPFNLAQNRPLRLLEIPLLIMDRSLFSYCYPGLPAEAVWAEMLSVLEPVRDYSGCVSILWHNTFFDEAAFPGYGGLYRRLLNWLQENNGWGASGGQVYDWFNAGAGA